MKIFGVVLVVIALIWAMTASGTSYDRRQAIRFSALIFSGGVIIYVTAFILQVVFLK